MVLSYAFCKKKVKGEQNEGNNINNTNYETNIENLDVNIENFPQILDDNIEYF